MTRTAIILAGGLGTRLRSAVPELPKCMAPVNGQPFLRYVIRHFKKQAIDTFIFALGYKSEAFLNFLSEELSPDQYLLSVEPEPLGTGGAIKLACSVAKENTLLVANGDTLFTVAVEKLSAFHDMCGAHCTLALKPLKEFDRYGVVELSDDYRVRSFREKQYFESGLINGGVYILNREKFLAEELPEKFSFEKDYLEKYYTDRRIFGYIQDEYFIDIGIPSDYERAKTELRSVVS